MIGIDKTRHVQDVNDIRGHLTTVSLGFTRFFFMRFPFELHSANPRTKEPTRDGTCSHLGNHSYRDPRVFCEPCKIVPWICRRWNFISPWVNPRFGESSGFVFASFGYPMQIHLVKSIRNKNYFR